MSRGLASWLGMFLELVALGTSAAQGARPAITGISHMSVYTSDAAAAEHFYAFDLGAMKGADPQDTTGVRYYLSPTQFVEVLPLPAEHGISRMARVAYATADAAGVRAYLAAHGAEHLSELRSAPDGSRWFEARDPEGNEVEVYQHGRLVEMGTAAPIGSRIIHVGYLVHSRAAEDGFYRDLLGFRPYWYGASKADAVDWVMEEVPEGQDWVEYMMVGDGSTTPLARVDQRSLGVMNHFSIGVPNIEKAVTVLVAEERMSARQSGPLLGKDGKWQATLFDPDGTRVELMEFQPVMKPCCSGFTAESPVK